jgi:hypothetical protein
VLETRFQVQFWKGYHNQFQKLGLSSIWVLLPRIETSGSNLPNLVPAQHWYKWV